MVGSRDVWEKLREGADLVQRVREPPGVLSKTNLAVVFMFIVLAVVAFKLANMWALLGIAAIAVIAFFVHQKITLDFAVKHPDLASTQGREWLQYQKWSASAKGARSLPPTEPTGNPKYIEHAPESEANHGA